ncbi:37S ribosomal protein NAM9 mitochondrial [Spathaspora sp. JA1]|nr:37S ribosomal protein NAM9 mitochondrial [Spathaspora sp. JA1]
MTRRADRLFNLARGRVRMSMNKKNLFNLIKKPEADYFGKTLYQQKYMAKTETRSYHGEHINETRWKHMFSPRLKSNVQLDASMRSSSNQRSTPMMMQTFAILEKRLEVAVFRAMFASSVRQARQFILGGHVKVNGVSVKHPSFPLQSGDVFNVDPEKVLYALGRNKPSVAKSIKIDTAQIVQYNNHVERAQRDPKREWEKQQKRTSLNTIANLEAKERQKLEFLQQRNQMKSTQDQVTRESILLDILKIGSAAATPVTAEAFSKYGVVDSKKCVEIYHKTRENAKDIVANPTLEAIKEFISPDEVQKTKQSDSIKHSARLIKAQLTELRKSQWTEIRRQVENAENTGTTPYDPTYAAKLAKVPLLNKEEILEDESKAVVQLPWQKHLYGRQDPTKAYATPWSPRGFLGCFSILPHHIEISFDTCHAVYLRDPIARPGHSEVITPSPEHVHERAYMYYRRKGM